MCSNRTSHFPPPIGGTTWKMGTLPSGREKSSVKQCAAIERNYTEKVRWKQYSINNIENSGKVAKIHLEGHMWILVGTIWCSLHIHWYFNRMYFWLITVIQNSTQAPCRFIIFHIKIYCRKYFLNVPEFKTLNLLFGNVANELANVIFWPSYYSFLYFICLTIG